MAGLDTLLIHYDSTTGDLEFRAAESRAEEDSSSCDDEPPTAQATDAKAERFPFRKCTIADVTEDELESVLSNIRVLYFHQCLGHLPRLLISAEVADEIEEVFVRDCVLAELVSDTPLLRNVRKLAYENVRICDFDGNPYKTFPENYAVFFSDKRMANYDRVTTLHMRQCRLTSVPDELEGLSNLRELDLSGNSIILARNLVMFSRLVVLVLAGNPLDEFPHIWKIPTLREVNVSNCGLGKLPFWVAEMSLRRLDISFNPGICYLPGSLIYPGTSSLLIDANGCTCRIEPSQGFVRHQIRTMEQFEFFRCCLCLRCGDISPQVDVFAVQWHSTQYYFGFILCEICRNGVHDNRIFETLGLTQPLESEQ